MEYINILKENEKKKEFKDAIEGVLRIQLPQGTVRGIEEAVRVFLTQSL